jgi:hypothetical protein
MEAKIAEKEVLSKAARDFCAAAKEGSYLLVPRGGQARRKADDIAYDIAKVSSPPAVQIRVGGRGRARGRGRGRGGSRAKARTKGKGKGRVAATTVARHMYEHNDRPAVHVQWTKPVAGQVGQVKLAPQGQKILYCDQVLPIPVVVLPVGVGGGRGARGTGTAGVLRVEAHEDWGRHNFLRFQ